MIRLSKHIFGDLSIPQDRLVGVFGPRSVTGEGLTDHEIAEKLRMPIGTPPLHELAQGCRNALVVTDDNTRETPLHRILPPLLSQMEQAGLPADRITILIGLGTHRPMTLEEMKRKFGEAICQRYRIVNHDWMDPDQLVSMGKCDLGFEVVINRLVRDTDLLISVGSIVPHATAGYSGGGKTIMPGICGGKTIADTHWCALDYEMRGILGNPQNEVREAIVSVCRKVGLHMIVNTVLFDEGKIYDLVAGDVDQAHRAGIEKCREVYGVQVPSKASIVIAEAYPTDIDLRQAIKAICSADLVCEDGGVIILPAECPEGAAPQFPAFAEYGFKDPEGLFEKVEEGVFGDKLLAYTLVAIGRIITKRLRAILVSPYIDHKAAESMGLFSAPDLQAAVTMALAKTSPDASIMVLKQAGEILPILASDTESANPSALRSN